MAAIYAVSSLVDGWLACHEMRGTYKEAGSKIHKQNADANRRSLRGHEGAAKKGEQNLMSTH
eukprot:scaffold148028_cov18-Tisochrysis_lutea.AAC.2